VRLLAAVAVLLATVTPASAAPAPPPRWPASPVSISADGQVVVFAQPEGAPPAIGFNVYFARDITHGETIPLGFALVGSRPPQAAVSADGRYVALAVATTDNPSVSHLVRYDLAERRSVPVDVDVTGGPADAGSAFPSISADGRYVAFSSIAANLTAGDTNGVEDVFVRDMARRLTGRVSVSSVGSQGGDASYAPSISGDGRYVAFSSDARNLVPGDTNSAVDVFLRDRRLGATHRVSLNSRGRQSETGVGSTSPTISADGRYIAFTSSSALLVDDDANEIQDVFVRDLRYGSTHRVNLTPTGIESARPADSPTISADGRYIAFESDADDLVPGDINRRGDVFLRDMRFGTTRLASVGSTEQHGNDASGDPHLSGDGRYLAFRSAAGNFGAPTDQGTPAAFERDLWTHTLRWISVDSGAAPPAPAATPVDINIPAWVSADGMTVAFTSGTMLDVNAWVYTPYVRELDRGTPLRLGSLPAPVDMDISGDGRTALVPVISPNPPPGLYSRPVRQLAAFDVRRRSYEQVSVNDEGQPGNGDSSGASSSGDGRWVAFASKASNLVPGDTNGAIDLFVRDRRLGQTRRVSLGRAGNQLASGADSGAISPDGRYLVFNSYSPDVFPGGGGDGGVFVRDLRLGTVRQADLDEAGRPGFGDSSAGLAFSADARYLLFRSDARGLVADDTDSHMDLFMRDLAAGTTRRVNVGNHGQQGGNYITYNDSAQASISADGRYVAFMSSATNLVPHDLNRRTDVFVRDLRLNTTELISVRPDGEQSDGDSDSPVISADGRFVVFGSGATNFLPPRLATYGDVYEVDRQRHTIARVNVELP
jgi:Tol biopolymer transport system component